MPMKQIWKYPLVPPPTGDTIEFEMPKGARILTVQMNGQLPALWALVDSGASKEARKFRFIATGTDVGDDSNLAYVGTFQAEGLLGILVFHLFEVVHP